MGNLPENESVCVNVFECIQLLLPYLFLEYTDRFRFRDLESISLKWNLDRKDETRVIANDQTVEFERPSSHARTLHGAKAKLC
jgi:hypothetical protein